MKLNVAGGVIAVIAIAALIVAYSALFTLYPTHQALVLRLGKTQAVITDPGLHVKAPFIDSVVYIDKRILDLEALAPYWDARVRMSPFSPTAAAAASRRGRRMKKRWKR